MKIGDRIKKRRIELGYSVDEVADKLGKNRATVYRYESNEIENLPITTLEPLAKALNTTPAHLMGWDSNDTDDVYVILRDYSEELGFHDCVKRVKDNKVRIGNSIYDDEIAFIKKYRSLDDYGKETVDIALERELKRCQAMDVKLNAAHELPNATEDGKVRDNKKIDRLLRDKK